MHTPEPPRKKLCKLQNYPPPSRYVYFRDCLKKLWGPPSQNFWASPQRFASPWKNFCERPCSRWNFWKQMYQRSISPHKTHLLIACRCNSITSIFVYHIMNDMLKCYVWASNHQPFDCWRAHHVYYVASQPSIPVHGHLIRHWGVFCLLACDNRRCSISSLRYFTHQIIILKTYSYLKIDRGVLIGKKNLHQALLSITLQSSIIQSNFDLISRSQNK